MTLNATIRRHNDVILRHCSNNSYPEVVNDEYIVVFNFAGRRMSGFEVIVAGGGGPRSSYPPSNGRNLKKKKKKPGLNSVKTTLENANRFNKG